MIRCMSQKNKSARGIGGARQGLWMKVSHGSVELKETNLETQRKQNH